MSALNPSGLSDEDEMRLLRSLQMQPDFDSLPIPVYWFKKYGIPPRAAVGPREYIESNYAMDKSTELKDLPPLIIDEPQQGGKLVPLHPPEIVKVEVVSRPFEHDSSKPFPATICPTHEEMDNTIKHVVNDGGRKFLHEINILSDLPPASLTCMSQTLDEHLPHDQHE